MRDWSQRIGRGSAAAGRSLLTFSRGRIGPVPRGVAAGAVLVVVALAVVVATVSGNSGTAHGSPVPGTGEHVVQPVRVSTAEFAKLPRATTFTSIPVAPLDPPPVAATSGLVVRPLTAQVVYAGPGKPPIAVLPATELGGPTWVPVVQASPGWERVLLPSRPNRSTGWIYTAGANATRLDTRRSPYLVRIYVAARKLSVFLNGRSLGTWTVAVGESKTPTPTGRTFIMASLAPPHPTYSPLILPLGFHSNTLTTFGGGPGTVGIHGWPNSSVFGRAVSHGCVRVPRAALTVLSRAPLGSLVMISR
jgi:lipoprotein-anchoring transpeptidase ErfK/SrfK